MTIFKECYKRNDIKEYKELFDKEYIDPIIALDELVNDSMLDQEYALSRKKKKKLY